MNARDGSKGKRARRRKATGLQRTRDNSVRSCAPNACKVLRMDTAWTGRIRLNAFADTVELDGELLADTDATAIQEQIADAYAVTFHRTDLNSAIDLVAREHAYHPVREYLESLTWDGVRRIDRLWCRYFGAEDTPLHRAYGRRFMVGCVARVMAPGCKLDTMPVLIGAQGIGKSTGLRVLAGSDWFSDGDVKPANDKDTLINMAGVWLQEFGEVERWQGRRAADTKAFLSRTEDVYRRPYERRTHKQPRQTVFVGTTNSGSFLDDPTGHRRYWPIPVTGLALGALEGDRDQLWAEALHSFSEPRAEPWHLTRQEEALHAAAVRGFTTEHPEDGALLAWLATTPGPITTLDAVRHGLGIDVSDANSREGKRASAALQRLGYRQDRSGGTRVWVPRDGDPS